MILFKKSQVFLAVTPQNTPISRIFLGLCLLMVALYYGKIDSKNLDHLITDFQHDMEIVDNKNRTILIHCLNFGKLSFASKLIDRGAYDIRNGFKGGVETFIFPQGRFINERSAQ